MIRRPPITVALLLLPGLLAAWSLACHQASSPTGPEATTVQSFEETEWNLAGGQMKIDVCHWDADLGVYIPITVGAPAVAAHRSHADSLVGESVAGNEWMLFDDTCAPMALVYSTGVDDAGVPLGDLMADPHYVIDGLSGLTTINDPGTWVANTTGSRWINPSGDGNEALPAQRYAYTTTFDLSGFDAANAVIRLDVAADNLARIHLNASYHGYWPGFTTFETVEIDNGFVAGMNTLVFEVENTTALPNPTGLQVRILEVSASPDL